MYSLSLVQFLNQIPISECYFTQIQHTTSLSQANSIHTQSQMGISTQKGISNSGAYFTCNTCNWYTRFVHIKVQVYYYNYYNYVHTWSCAVPAVWARVTNYEITTDHIIHVLLTAPIHTWFYSLCIYCNIILYTFEGIHPTLRQVPPRVGSFSTQTVCTSKTINNL